MYPVRDNFPVPTKRKLADRVAWRCSFPGCRKITIGPGTESSEAVINLGEAAHIHAAATNGPRYDSQMDSNERKSIDNGVWMCRHHAKLIDADFINYSAETIRQWKNLAERETYKALKQQEEVTSPPPTTLIQLGENIVTEGVWKAAKNNKWKFDLIQFVYGGIHELRSFSLPDSAPYIVIESQGDGRIIRDFNWSLKEGKYRIQVKTENKEPREDPNSLGGDLALGDGFDILFEEGDFKMVEGIENAIQQIRTILSTKNGDLFYAPQLGSKFSSYFWDFKHNPPFLNRLLKLEITKLLSIPYRDKTSGDTSPLLNFINRVISSEVIDRAPMNNQVRIKLKLELGINNIWQGVVSVYVPPINKSAT